MTWIESHIFTLALCFAGGLVWGYLLAQWHQRYLIRRRRKARKQTYRCLLADLDLEDS